MTPQSMDGTRIRRTSTSKRPEEETTPGHRQQPRPGHRLQQLNLGPLLEHLRNRIGADGYDVDECDATIELGDDEFAALRSATGGYEFVSSITAQRSRRNSDLVVIAWASPGPCSVEYASPQPPAPEGVETTPQAILRDRIETALRDLSSSELAADELQTEMESRFADLESSNVRTTIVQGRRAIAVAKGPLCIYGLTTDPISVWEPLTGSTGDECTAQEAAQGGP